MDVIHLDEKSNIYSINETTQISCNIDIKSIFKTTCNMKSIIYDKIYQKYKYILMDIEKIYGYQIQYGDEETFISIEPNHHELPLEFMIDNIIKYVSKNKWECQSLYKDKYYYYEFNIPFVMKFTIFVDKELLWDKYRRKLHKNIIVLCQTEKKNEDIIKMQKRIIEEQQKTIEEYKKIIEYFKKWSQQQLDDITKITHDKKDRIIKLIKENNVLKKIHMV